MNLSELLPYCTTKRQKQILKERIKHSTDGQTAKAIGDITRQTVSKTIQTIKERAAKQGFAPDHDLTKVVAPGFGVKRVSTNYDEDGVIRQQWVISSPEAQDQLQALEELVADLTEGIKPAKPIKTPKTLTDDLLAMYPLGDPHIGLGTYFSETGEDYTLDKAELLFVTAMSRAVEKAPKCKEAMITNVGDLYHADNAQNRTRQSGNPLDVYGGFGDRFQMGYRIMIQLINLALTKHEIVHVRNARGNHDEHLSVALMHVLSSHFRDEPRVKIYTDTTFYQYHQFGKCLFGITHGDQCKPNDLEGIMAADMPKAWGETRHRYWLTGHIHHDVIKEYRGCKFESFRTLAPKDAWHNGRGYRSDRDLKVIVYHKEYGEVERHTTNITQFSDVFKEYAA